MQKQEFMNDNEDFLIDLYRKKGNTNLGIDFINYLKK